MRIEDTDRIERFLDALMQFQQRGRQRMKGARRLVRSAKKRGVPAMALGPRSQRA